MLQFIGSTINRWSHPHHQHGFHRKILRFLVWNERAPEKKKKNTKNRPFWVLTFDTQTLEALGMPLSSMIFSTQKSMYRYVDATWIALWGFLDDVALFVCCGSTWILGGGNSNIFYFHPYLGKISNLTMSHLGWNHQLVLKPFTFGRHTWSCSPSSLQRRDNFDEIKLIFADIDSYSYIGLS